MAAGTLAASAQKSHRLRKKSLFRLDKSNRIFLVTEKQKEESHGGDNFNIITGQTIDKGNDITSKPQKKSFKKSCRNALDGLKRKITKIRRSLFSHETTSNEIQTPTSSHPLISDLSPSIISDDATSNQLLTTNRNYNLTESSEIDALRKLICEMVAHDDATLNDLHPQASKLIDEMIARDNATFNDLLARADKLTKAPLSRTSIHRRRKRFIIACSTLLVALTIIITIIIFVVVMTLRHKAHKNRMSKTSSVYYV